MVISCFRPCCPIHFPGSSDWTSELLGRVAAGGGALKRPGSPDGTKVHLPRANLNDIALIMYLIFRLDGCVVVD